MGGTPLLQRVRALDRPRGPERRVLTLGPLRLRLDGLDAGLAGRLERRWGPFLTSDDPDDANAEVRVLEDEGPPWIDDPRPGEIYRIEALGAGDGTVIVSYRFALARDADRHRGWSLALRRSTVEPGERALENALRAIAARLALDRGGFALHGAGVAHEGRAWVVAGPSRTGKSTAVRALAPAARLGDDFAMVLRDDDGRWIVPAVPFDNAERIPEDAARGSYALVGLYRLRQAPAFRLERPPGPLAVASLLHCAAFPWALPEQEARLLDHARDLVEDGRFFHLHFARDTDLWTELIRNAPGGP